MFIFPPQPALVFKFILIPFAFKSNKSVPTNPILSTSNFKVVKFGKYASCSSVSFWEKSPIPTDALSTINPIASSATSSFSHTLPEESVNVSL